MIEVLQELPWYAWVGIVAIVGGTISSCTKIMTRHKERMAMIERGLHPSLLKKATSEEIAE